MPSRTAKVKKYQSKTFLPGGMQEKMRLLGQILLQRLVNRGPNGYQGSYKPCKGGGSMRFVQRRSKDIKQLSKTPSLWAQRMGPSSSVTAPLPQVSTGRVLPHPVAQNPILMNTKSGGQTPTSSSLSYLGCHVSLAWQSLSVPT